MRIGRFVWRVAKAFRANQGFLLSGAVAYYTLLSIVPLFTLLLIVLSHFIDQHLLIGTLGQYLSFMLPGEEESVMQQVRSLIEHREVAGWVLFGVLLFFSSMAFTILENAMSVIFIHRVAIRRRHFLVSALLPYFYILLIGAGLLATTFISGALQTLDENVVRLFGRQLPIDRVSIVLLYLIGFAGEVAMITAIYLVMPVGRLSLRHALLGGLVAAVLWEITRRALVWYFSTLSLVNVVYGSLATTIVVLLTLEVAAMILLIGAQVIAEYERGIRSSSFDSQPMRTVQ